MGDLKTAIVRIWRAFGPQPLRVENVKFSKDPQVQELNRDQPIPLAPGVSARQSHDCERHRVRTLLCSPKAIHHHGQLGRVLSPGRSVFLSHGLLFFMTAFREELEKRKLPHTVGVQPQDFLPSRAALHVWTNPFG